MLPLPFTVTGRTYPHRDAMRSLGGSWDRFAKAWRFSDEVAAKRAQAIVDGVPFAPVAPGAIAQPASVQVAPPATVATDPATEASATVVLREMLAKLPPRALADALIAAGLQRSDAEAIAVGAACAIRGLGSVAA